MDRRISPCSQETMSSGITSTFRGLRPGSIPAAASFTFTAFSPAAARPKRMLLERFVPTKERHSHYSGKDFTCRLAADPFLGHDAFRGHHNRSCGHAGRHQTGIAIGALVAWENFEGLGLQPRSARPARKRAVALSKLLQANYSRRPVRLVCVKCVVAIREDRSAGRN